MRHAGSHSRGQSRPSQLSTRSTTKSITSSLSSFTAHCFPRQQKVTALTRPTTTPALIALGTSNSQLSLLNYDTLEPIWPSIDYGVGEEIYDVDFNDQGNLVRLSTNPGMKDDR